MACKVGRLVSKDTALFICDIQEKFRNMIQFFPGIVEVSSRLLKAAKILDLPVVVTEQYPKGLGNTVSEIGLADYPDIRPITKTQFSMMVPEVVDLLTKQHSNVKSVILVGIEAHVCVQGTCLNLLEKGLDVHVVVDGVSSRSNVDRMFALDRMKSAGAWLTTSESAILGLVGDASHPNFKQCQKLILNQPPDTGLSSLFSSRV
ncbi:isochorismatase domain-containing protein 2-like [Panonychus citri]|uniref:isochorismatase domain-containing protein 2-like n=1 Tax=Panonychus citri TaxID=50023 RepID=UPI002307B8FC|nr:isochorismatase domain-containing protein 2-like [Panonychus citri]